MLKSALRNPNLAKVKGKVKAALAWIHAALHGAEWKRQAEEWQKRAEVLAENAKFMKDL